MFKKLSLFLLLGCFFFTGTAQVKLDSIAQVKDAYQKYFGLNREAVYLQLNKTKVIPQENIWFSAYVFDSRIMKPSSKTTNLHVNLYDDQGKLMEAKTLFINNGKGEGFFKLDTIRYHPGDYLIKASTKYMANFKENLAFTQGFSILGKPKKSTPAQ